ncbi:MAG: hypothetical protein ACPHFO_07070, partial [Acidimicrobiales bacterium]
MVIGINRCFVNLQSVESGGARTVVGDVSGDRCRRHDDRVAGFRCCHENHQVGHGPGGHAEFDEPSVEDLRCQLRCNDFDL